MFFSSLPEVSTGAVALLYESWYDGDAMIFYDDSIINQDAFKPSLHSCVVYMYV